MQQSGQTRGGVLLTGASGLVGKAIAAELTRKGIQLVRATRGGASPAVRTIRWEPESAAPFADPAALEGLDLAIHLSGANLAAHRWTPAYKREILTSRTLSTTGLAGTLAALKEPPRLLITASATGIYGDRGDELLTESSAPGPKGDFLTETCQAWEASTARASAAGIRVVHLRFGVVLDAQGGALAKMLPLFRLGLGGRLGSGGQWMSWIAIDDLVGAVMHIAGYSESSSSAAGPLEGPVNCISPAPVTNAEFIRALAHTLHRPALAPAPAFALRLALGEMADAALLSSCRAVPEKLLASGFRFRFPEIGPALAHVLAG
jgi:uncharacterized protein (TIGR01777 family)